MTKSYGKALSVLVATMLTATLAWSYVALASPGSPGKFSGNPDAGLSDAQKQAKVDSAHAADDQFLAAFVRSGEDPRSLPEAEVESWSAVPANISDAIAGADVILSGQVTAVAFRPGIGGSLPISTATVAVSTLSKGASSSLVHVTQLGGPVAWGPNGSLVHLDKDELILPGDTVTLFLKIAKDGTLRTLPGVGVYWSHGGAISAEDSNPFRDKVSLLPEAAFKTLIESAIASGH